MERWEQLEQLFRWRCSPIANQADMALREACKWAAMLEVDQRYQREVLRKARDHLVSQGYDRTSPLRVEMDYALGINGDEA